jgi:histidinol-phosphate aminotransferase
MRKIWRDVLDHVTPYDAGQPLEALQRGLGLEAIVRLSANENPLGPSPRAIAAIREEAVRAHLYPDGGSSALRGALGRWVGVAPDWLVVGNGADELIGLIARAAFEPGDEVMLPHPSFEPYHIEATLAGAKPVVSPLRGYDTDLEDIRRRISAQTKAVFLCTPHNPASTLIPRRPLQAFLDSLGRDAPLVVVDEAYRDFSDDPERPDGAALVADHPTVIALRTFSKIAGLAGMRIGYAIARPETIDRLNRVRAPYNVNRLAQAAALAALGDPDHLARSRALVLQERPRLAAAIRERGAHVPPPQANFLLARVGPEAPALGAALLEAGILVRDGGAVGFPGHLRITVGTSEQNDRLLAVWDTFSRRVRSVSGA